MILGAYTAHWLPLQFGNGSTGHAIVFTASEAGELIETDTSIQTVAPLIASARGKLGSNADYLLRLRDALIENRLRDSYVDEMVAAVAVQVDSQVGDS
jgi:cation transport protein ChaC